MVKRIISFLVVFSLFASINSFSIHAYAQAPQGLTNEEKAELSGTRKQLATIIFAGLAGAILGLSTLSFYGRPQEHLTNIAIGGALGVIGGAIFTTYKAATNPYEAYDINAKLKNEEKYLLESQDLYSISQNSLNPKMIWVWTF